MWFPPLCLPDKDSIFMGNINEKQISGLLERISGIKAELEALEEEVRGLCQATKPAEATEPAEKAEPSTTGAEARPGHQPTGATEPETPIDIDLPDIDIQPIVEDPAAGYKVTPDTEIQPLAEPVDAVARTEAEEPATTVDEPVEATARTEAEEPATTVDEPVEATARTEAEDPGEATAPAAMDDLPFDDDLPIEEVPAQAPATPAAEEPKAAILDSKKAETAVMDVMAEKQAWRTDRPGSQVKNVISAISLNDRVLLINVLFREDPMLFQDTISAFNGMASLDEALAYIQTHFPEWDMNSEPVYRLMMAVRRKLS